MKHNPKILVACEFSGIVREAFSVRGYDAWSCDFLPSELPGQHIQGDVLKILNWGWDLMVAHPPCTHLAVSGARWFEYKEKEQEEALEFVRLLLESPIPRIAIENPKSVISTRIRPPDQIVHPWWFGHGEKKLTCWWLKNLPPLKPTNIVEGRAERVLNAPDSRGRQRDRSRTYTGMADAIANQWGEYA
jgi:hypothetical protein